MRLSSIIGTMSRERKDLRIIYQELTFEIATIILTNSRRKNAPSPRILVSLISLAPKAFWTKTTSYSSLYFDA